MNDYRTLETADAGSGFGVRDGIVDEITRAQPYATGSANRLASVLSLAPTGLPSVPELAAMGQVAERIVDATNVVNANAATMGGTAVPVTVSPTGAASLSMRIDGGAVGETVIVTYEIEQTGLADTTVQTLAVVLGAGLMDLGTAPGSARISPIDVSANGSVIAGNLSGVVPSQDTSTFRWTELGGMQDLGVQQGALDSQATAVSADGTVVIGTSGPAAFMWQPGTGMTPMVGTGGQQVVSPTAMTPDASTIVGRTVESVFRLRGADLETISVPANALDFQVLDVSADGETILGNLFRFADITPAGERIIGSSGTSIGSGGFRRTEPDQ